MNIVCSIEGMNFVFISSKTMVKAIFHLFFALICKLWFSVTKIALQLQLYVRLLIIYFFAGDSCREKCNAASM